MTQLRVTSNGPSLEGNRWALKFKNFVSIWKTYSGPLGQWKTVTEDQVSKAPDTLSGAFLACNRSCRQGQQSPVQLLPMALMRKPAWLGLRGQGEVTETLLMATLHHILCVPSVSPMKRPSQPGMQRKGVEGSGFQERIWLLYLCAFPGLTPKASTLVGRNLLHQWDCHISDPNSSFPLTVFEMNWIYVPWLRSP